MIFLNHQDYVETFRENSNSFKDFCHLLRVTRYVGEMICWLGSYVNGWLISQSSELACDKTGFSASLIAVVLKGTALGWGARTHWKYVRGSRSFHWAETRNAVDILQCSRLFHSVTNYLLSGTTFKCFAEEVSKNSILFWA